MMGGSGCFGNDFHDMHFCLPFCPQVSLRLLYNQTRLASGSECAILALPWDLAAPKRASLHNAATSLSRVPGYWFQGILHVYLSR